LGKTSKTTALLVVIVLSGILIYNIFSEPAKKPFDPQIYDAKLKPINFPPKKFPKYAQDDNDIAIKIVRLWKLTEIYNRTSESCLETLADQHPNNVVQKQNWTSLYGIEIGTSYWYELTSAYEKYATEGCYSFSSHEMETFYAEGLKEKLTKKELTKLFNFFSTELGRKYVAASLYSAEKYQKEIAQKQREAINRELEIYNKKIEELQKRSQ